MDSVFTVDCKECPFREVIGPEDDELPAEVLVAHGRERGHRLVLEQECPVDSASD